MATPYAEFLSFARHLALVAAAQIMPRFRTCTVLEKPDGTEVTEADRAAEHAVRELIARRYPGHDILGEEYGAAGAGHPLRWIIDPIDGTAAFTLGMPTFGTLIALTEDQEPVVGVIHLPAVAETVFAARGGGCWFEVSGQPAQRVTTTAVQHLQNATVSATSVHSSDVWCTAGQTPFQLSKVIRTARKFRFVGDCLQHALLCRGRVHAAIDPVMQAWDIAAVVPCIEEAGGVVGDMQGRRECILDAKSLLAAATPQLQAELIEVLQPS